MSQNDWLGVECSILYPIMMKSPRFPELAHWGDRIDRTKAGAYFLIALTPEGNRQERQIIPRMFGPDENGTLYIGKGDNLAGRLGQLGNSLLPGKTSAPHGISKIRKFYSERLPSETLAVSWIYLTDTEYATASSLEAELIRIYILAFGEAPPFNSQGSMTDDNQLLSVEDGSPTTAV